MNSASASPSAIADSIRECLTIMANDLEVIRMAAGEMIACAEAVKRVSRQVAELKRLADKLHPPPG